MGGEVLSAYIINLYFQPVHVEYKRVRVQAIQVKGQWEGPDGLLGALDHVNFTESLSMNRDQLEMYRLYRAVAITEF